MTEHFSHQFKLSGPDRYCPHCKRLLVHVHDDGAFDLAEGAAIEGKQAITWTEDDEIESQEVMFEAICLHKVCRLKEIVSSVIRL